MQRYFFDLVGQRPQYDFSGQVLPSVDSAYELAELMAIDLAIEPDEPWKGWCIHVLTSTGQRLHRVPVQEQCLAMA